MQSQQRSKNIILILKQETVAKKRIAILLKNSNPMMADRVGFPELRLGPGLGSDSPPGCHSLPRPSNPRREFQKISPRHSAGADLLAKDCNFNKMRVIVIIYSG